MHFTTLSRREYLLQTARRNALHSQTELQNYIQCGAPKRQKKNI